MSTQRSEILYLRLRPFSCVVVSEPNLKGYRTFRVQGCGFSFETDIGTYRDMAFHFILYIETPKWRIVIQLLSLVIKLLINYCNENLSWCVDIPPDSLSISRHAAV